MALDTSEKLQNTAFAGLNELVSVVKDYGKTEGSEKGSDVGIGTGTGTGEIALESLSVDAVISETGNIMQQINTSLGDKNLAKYDLLKMDLNNRKSQLITYKDLYLDQKNKLTSTTQGKIDQKIKESTKNLVLGEISKLQQEAIALASSELILKNNTIDFGKGLILTATNTRPLQQEYILVDTIYYSGAEATFNGIKNLLGIKDISNISGNREDLESFYKNKISEKANTININVISKTNEIKQLTSNNADNSNDIAVLSYRIAAIDKQIRDIDKKISDSEGKKILIEKEINAKQTIAEKQKMYQKILGGRQEDLVGIENNLPMLLSLIEEKQKITSALGIIGKPDIAAMSFDAYKKAKASIDDLKKQEQLNGKDLLIVKYNAEASFLKSLGLEYDPSKKDSSPLNIALKPYNNRTLTLNPVTKDLNAFKVDFGNLIKDKGDKKSFDRSTISEIGLGKNDAGQNCLVIRYRDDKKESSSALRVPLVGSTEEGVKFMSYVAKNFTKKIV